MIHLFDGVLSVQGQDVVGFYPIEPARFDLGLTRVEMVDWHLDQIAEVYAKAVDGKRYAPDLDALLEARSHFAGEPA